MMSDDNLIDDKKLEQALLSIIEPMNTAIANFTTAMEVLAKSLGIWIEEIDMTPIQLLLRQKWEHESWHEYLDRVGHDVLDNPDIRWEYQKHIISTPYRLLKVLLR